MFLQSEENTNNGGLNKGKHNNSKKGQGVLWTNSISGNPNARLLNSISFKLIPAF